MSESAVPNLVKVAFGDDMRRFSTSETSFVALLDYFRTSFALAPDADLTVKYLDDENDWIRVTCDQELLCAFQSSNGKVLKLVLDEKKKADAMDVQIPSVDCVANVPANDLPLPDASSFAPSPQPTSFASFVQSRGPIVHPHQIGNIGVLHDEVWKAKKKHAKEWKCAKKREKRMAKHHSKNEEGAARLTARFIKDGNKEPLWVVAGSPFNKMWRVRNEGPLPWPVNCSLRFKKGQQMAPQDCIVFTREVPAGEEVDLGVDAVAPSVPGRYVGVWRLHDPSGRQFGHPLKMKIKVPDPSGSSSSSSSSEKETNTTDNYQAYMSDPAWSALLAQLNTMGFSNFKLNIKLINKCNGDLDKVVWKLLKKQRKEAKKQTKHNNSINNCNTEVNAKMSGLHINN